MKQVQGYVFIADFGRECPMFGLSVGNEPRGYENFESNRLTPFETARQAQEASQEFLENLQPQAVSIKQIKMILGNGVRDCSFFEGKTNLVGVMENDDSYDLFGPWIKGCNPITADNIAARLKNNGYRTFNKKSLQKQPIHSLESPYAYAMYAISDATRQSQAYCFLATLNLK
jgi:hypothetical protein